MSQANTTVTDDWARRLASLPVDESVRMLGAHVLGDQVVFAFWVPHLTATPDADVVLHLYEGPVDPAADRQVVTFRHHELEMEVVGPFAVLAVDGVAVGTRTSVGALYHARVEGEDLQDPLAASTPFGAFAPAEVLDAASLHDGRSDGAFYEGLAGGGDRQTQPTNILQVHVGAATASGTIAELAETIASVADAIRSGRDLADHELLFTGYDAIELLPIEPPIGIEGAPEPWTEIDRTGDEVTVRIEPGRVLDWGYDIPISGGAAVNPSILRTGRPHEVVDLSVACHTFPERPIRLIADVVYGHADNQALRIMHDAWFTGPDMYGQHLDYRNEIVRAHLLEMQRRKIDLGFDGVRVDGAQDFTWWDPVERVLHRDDDFMVEQSDLVQSVGGVRYRPWMIFEDGRPWPRDDWELSSTYRAVTEVQPHAFQWGPLTFAHNTPFLFTFWLSKWWRLREVTDFGSRWISGCANHDTLRRGSQVDPQERINTYLGSTLPEVIERAYDNPAATLLFHAFLPGVPMDFLNAIARAPWSFVRNTDRRYALKVWGEEARFLDWRVTADRYAESDSFPRLKAAGFDELEGLRSFMAHLAAAVALHGDDIDPVVGALATAPLPTGVEPTEEALLDLARRWMDDVADYCSVPRWLHRLDRSTVAFDAAVREYRRANPWLSDDLGAGDTFDHRHPARGSVVFGGRRRSPDGSKEVLFVANMEGSPVEVVPEESVAGARGGEWRRVLHSPRLGDFGAADPVVLSDGEGVVFER